jgi:hypothetical protein
MAASILRKTSIKTWLKYAQGPGERAFLCKMRMLKIKDEEMAAQRRPPSLLGRLSTSESVLHIHIYIYYILYMSRNSCQYSDALWAER